MRTVLSSCLAFVLVFVAVAPVVAADGESPLHMAAGQQDVALAAALIESGADVAATDVLGRTPLHIAAMSDKVKLVSMLLEAGADVNAVDSQGNTPLHFAARRFHADVLELLLDAGADATAENTNGQTALHVLGSAAREQDDEFMALLNQMAAQLIAAGADAAIIADGFPGLIPAEEAGGASSRNTWTSYADIGPDMLAWETAYPTLAKRYDLGLSYQGRHLWALRISDNVGVEEDEPEFTYISTMHGDEIVGVKMCMLLIDELLTNYGSDAQITNIVNEVDLWIVPLMNPDGYDRTSRTRYNAQGYDLNRNFPDYGEANDPTGRPTEVQVVMNWRNGRHFVTSANFHGGALVVNYPYDNELTGTRYTDFNNLEIYISEEYSQHNSPMWNSSSFYHGITLGADWYIVYGCMQDWAYHFTRCNEVTIELGNTKEPSASTIPTYWSQNRDSMLAYIDTCLIGARGVVTDANTGAPIAADVTVVGRYPSVPTDPATGNYHRMLIAGTYDLHFEADGYDPVTVPVTVATTGAPATRVDVQMGTPAAVSYPNGGETLGAGVPTTVTWTGNPTAQFQVQYSDNYGDSDTIFDGFESGFISGDYTMGGNLPWTITNNNAHSGGRSARSGAITHSQTTSMARTVGGGDVSFWYSVSSESGWDFFNFYIDGVRQIHASGTVGWTQYTTTLSIAPHTLTWEYTKDSNTSSGSDTAWIDDLEVVDDSTAWTDIVALTPVGATSTAWTPPAEGNTYRVRVRAVYGGSTYGDWDESDADFEVGPGGVTGDMNCDGAVDVFDIDAFVLAITNASGYAAAYPECDINLADCNGDASVDVFDIDAFVDTVTGG
ncbi:MAG: ankyrin repeat domain-containing protein [Phycisphaerae bacterium]|nr:ankyrin repeat domain-containing protein [Phycisphaerae bacterium]